MVKVEEVVILLQDSCVCTTAFGPISPFRFRDLFKSLYLQSILSDVKDLLPSVCSCIWSDMSAQS